VAGTPPQDVSIKLGMSSGQAEGKVCVVDIFIGGYERF
jgi:hypothetical protein